MGVIYFLAALVFVGLGVYGGMCAYARLTGGDRGFLCFEPLWGMYFGLAQFFALAGAAAGFHALNGNAFLVELALFPFGVLGTVMWGFGFAMESGSRFMADTAGKVVRTFDRGDGLMTQNKFAEAEQEFRTARQEEPGNMEALLRLSRALEGQQKYEMAAQELAAALRGIIDQRNDPALEKDPWQPKVLLITYALGDLYAGKLSDSERALRLYKSTLELLYGYRDANPLRERLKRLERASAELPVDPAEAVPHRLSMNE